MLLGSMLQEHERAAGGWQAEWEAIPDLFRFTMGAVERVKTSLWAAGRNRRVCGPISPRQAACSWRSRLPWRWRRAIGRARPGLLVREVDEPGCELRAGTCGGIANERIHLRSALSAGMLEPALDPAKYLGSTDAYIDRALDEFAELHRRREERHAPDGGLSDA